ncbi:hypothetical protein ATANTOWER_010047 [Ataeniobius toweri]|uniref:Uncharacterized protein n=1 Tax=Ataeniobius toweri TaxID=208326 RepID=A0ABU7B229_9TELE|nr:hypothetical protein [Ataeniobius toweri]
MIFQKVISINWLKQLFPQTISTVTFCLPSSTELPETSQRRSLSWGPSWHIIQVVSLAKYPAPPAIRERPVVLGNPVLGPPGVVEPSCSAMRGSRGCSVRP